MAKKGFIPALKQQLHNLLTNNSQSFQYANESANKRKLSLHAKPESAKKQRQVAKTTNTVPCKSNDAAVNETAPDFLMHDFSGVADDLFAQRLLDFDRDDDIETEIRLNLIIKQISHFFISESWTFAEYCCSICEKIFYKHQISILFLKECSEFAKGYLPPELKKLSFLQVCGRCKPILKDPKRLSPPNRAYWNCMRPGVVPDVIKNLTLMERQVLRRVSLYIQVTKPPMHHAQYSLKGQAMFFSQDINDVLDQVINVLPRSLETSNIILLNEEIPTHKGTSLFREYQIRLDAVQLAYQWLEKHNSLYKKTTLDVAMLENITQTVHKHVIRQKRNYWQQFNQKFSNDLLLRGQYQINSSKFLDRSVIFLVGCILLTFFL